MCCCRGLVSLQASAGAQAKSGNPCATPSTTSKHARQLPFTSSTPTSTVPKQATASSPGFSLPKQAPAVTPGLYKASADSPALSLPSQAALRSPSYGLPDLATPAAAGLYQDNSDSPALSLPGKVDCGFLEQTAAEHGIDQSHPADASASTFKATQQDGGPTGDKEQEIEAFVLSDLWKVFVQEIAQVTTLSPGHCVSICADHWTVNHILSCS